MSKRVRLGKGAYSNVYVNKDDPDKVTKRFLESEEESVEYFIIREISALKGMKSPYIVSLSGYDIDKREVYMPRYQEDLSKLIKRSSGEIPQEKIKSISFQILMGLDYMHSRGLIHRDVKPHNVLLDADGRAVLADFGISRMVDYSGETTDKTYDVITPWYRPPEIHMKNRRYSFEVDIWSFGCVLFELVTGKCLIRDEGTEALKKQAKYFGRASWFDDYANLNETKKILGRWEKRCKKDEVTKEYKTLLDKIFKMDADKRPKAYQILNSSVYLPLLKGKKIKSVETRYKKMLLESTFPDISLDASSLRREILEKIALREETNPANYFRFLDLIDMTQLQKVRKQKEQKEKEEQEKEEKEILKKAICRYWACYGISSKMENVEPVCQEVLEDLYVKSLKGLGLAEDAKKEDLIKEEKAVLKELDFNLFRPSLNDYLCFWMKGDSFHYEEVKVLLYKLSLNQGFRKFHSSSLLTVALFVITGERIDRDFETNDVRECFDWVMETLDAPSEERESS